MSRDHPLPFQQQQQQQQQQTGDGDSLDLTNNNAMAMLKAAQQQQLGIGFPRGNANISLPSTQQLNSMLNAGAMIGGGNDQSQQQPLQQQQPLDFQQELKRLNQQLSNATGTSSNALLMTGNNSSSSSQQNNINATALFQSLMFEQQQRNMGLQSQQQPQQQQQQQPQSPLQPQQTLSGNNLANAMLQPGFFQDPRLLVTQNQLASLQRQLDVPLSSPHSMFHRDGSRRMRGGVIEPFPEKLMRLLNECEAAGRTDVVSWIANGRAFAIHKPDKFFKEIVPLYFRQSRLSSFKRQLNLYGFELINSGPARGGYFHELFVRDNPDICRRMRRVAVKLGSGKEKEAAKVEEGEQQQQHSHSETHPPMNLEANILAYGGDKSDEFSPRSNEGSETRHG